MPTHVMLAKFTDRGEAVLYSVGSLGNVRTKTPRAFTAQETTQALARLA